jgi:hypothetical protein
MNILKQILFDADIIENGFFSFSSKVLQPPSVLKDVECMFKAQEGFLQKSAK